jgi:hypothetical protein
METWTWATWVPIGVSALALIVSGATAWATWIAPRSAAQLAEHLRSASGRADTRDNLRRYVFFTLMQERATVTSPQAVQALNSVDVIFHDVPSVREAWADLYHYFSSGKVEQRFVDEKLRELLRQLAIALGVSETLRRDDFSRVYFPTALAEQHYIQVLERTAALSRLQGAGAKPTANTAPQFATSSPRPPTD